MLLGKTITEIKELLKTKKITREEVFSFFNKRIEKHNPQINAYLTIKDQPENPVVDGVLSGIPLAIKDNFCTKGVRTTASAKVLDNFIPPYESTVTTRLKAAGYELLGKTNMDAWAHGSSTETSDYGATKNPWDISRSPGGSSGGTAAAVSCYLAPGGIGSETAGSIRQPASWSGVVGLKPTYGRVSRYGVIAMGSSLDCPGPLTLSVEDAALIFQSIAGNDKYDATSSPVPTEDYLSKMKEKKSYTIGIADEYFEGLDEDIKKSLEESIKIFEKMGFKTKKVSLLSPQYSISVYTIIQRAEVMSNLSRYDGIRYGNPRTFFGSEAKRRGMLGTYTLSYGYYDAFFKKAQKVRTLIIEDFKRAFKDVDFIIGTPSPITALKLGEFEKYPFFGELMDKFNEPGAMAGIPGISLPTGLDRNGLPMSIHLMANYFREADLLNASYQFEKETDFMGVIKKGVKNLEAKS
ncbi:MAG: amidase family protein [Microgenomates group bacterium]